MYKHLFGPVPSRRLGMSLGVDLVPHKVCSLNCVYCECGGTTKLTTLRGEYVPLGEIREELDHFFSHQPDPEYITFSGAGEPTLHSGIGDVLAYLKEIRSRVPVAVITNGTLLSDPSVRRELLRADVVLPSLDAATDTTFRKINRPAKGISISEYINGLVAFRKEYHGSIWLEVFLLPGFNDQDENLKALKAAIQSIAPDRIQLNTLDRPGVIQGLRPASRQELERIREDWGPERVEIIASPLERRQSGAYREDTESVILEVISRRPCTAEDIREILGIHIHEVNKYLGSLEASGRILAVQQQRGVFYRVRKS
jgi:wyosine [tRNA(Phe)-imidazoG37] synthetase (radical SAM superfamily)